MSVTDMSPIEIINLSLDLTQAMKKSFGKKGSDDFKLSELSWLKFFDLNLDGSSNLKHINFSILKNLLAYIFYIEESLASEDKETTYTSVRLALMQQKQSYFTQLRRNLQNK